MQLRYSDKFGICIGFTHTSTKTLLDMVGLTAFKGINYYNALNLQPLKALYGIVIN